MTKECPLCGEAMRLEERERVALIPGTSQTVRRKVAEWTCPECDYFEELSDDEDAGRDTLTMVD